jgi:hypothetical protein
MTGAEVHVADATISAAEYATYHPARVGVSATCMFASFRRAVRLIRRF